LEIRQVEPLIQLFAYLFSVELFAAAINVLTGFLEY